LYIEKRNQSLIAYVNPCQNGSINVGTDIFPHTTKNLSGLAAIVLCIVRMRGIMGQLGLMPLLDPGFEVVGS
jgi:hypothetical protein